MFACVGIYVSILTCASEKIKHTSPLMLSGKKAFHMGPWYPLLPTPAKKWCSVFVANPCFLSWLRPPGKENTFYRQAWETPWQNRLQTLCADTEMLITSVFSVLPSQSSTICHYFSFCLGHYLLFYLNVQMFPMGGDGDRKILSTFLVDSLQGYRTLSLPPSITQAHLCLSLSLFDFLYFSFCPSSSFHQNFTKWELCGLLCAGGKGALD